MSYYKIAFLVLALLACSWNAKAQTGPEVPTTDTANTTTTTEATTIVTTTTAAPPHKPDAVVNTFKVKNGTQTCLLVSLKTSFILPDKKVVNVGNDSVVNTVTSGCDKLNVTFSSGSWFVLQFAKEDKEFYLKDVMVKTNGVSAQAMNQTIGKTSLYASYKCIKGIDISLSNKTTMNATDVQFQPFEVKDDKFGTANNCNSDLSPIIPIVVGSVLAFLVLVVLIAYIIGRRRSRTGYEEI